MLTNMLKNKKLFIFDMDGTLIESLGVWSEADRLFLRNVTGVEIDALRVGHIRDRYLSECKEDNPYVAWVNHIKTIYNVESDLESLIEYRKNICYNLIEKMVRLKPYAKELLSLLKSHGYKLCLSSVSAPGSVNRILYEIEETSFLGNDVFDLVMNSASVAQIKPAPDVHLKALEYFNVNPEDAVVIEDSYVGLEAARNAGLDSIIVKEELADRQEEIKRDAKVYVDSLGDIYDSMLKIVENKPKLR